MKRVLQVLVSLGLLAAVGLLVPFMYLSHSRIYTNVSIPAHGYELTGYLSEGNEADGRWIIFGHGNRKEGEDHPLYRQVLNNLPKEIGVLAIDFRGFGESSDDQLGNSDRILDRGEDIQAAVKYLSDQKGIFENQVILIGHSFGAAQVVNAANDRTYQLVIPIGLGDWQSVTTDTNKMMGYLRKFEENTGVALNPEKFIEEGSQFTPQAIVHSCPKTPIAFVFAGFDDGLEPMRIQYERDNGQCSTLVGWETVPFANHAYGTEDAMLPGPLQSLYSKIIISYLIWQINHLLASQ